MARRATPSLRAVFTNWRGPLPPWTKLRMALGNTWTKVRDPPELLRQPGPARVLSPPRGAWSGSGGAQP